MNAPNPGGDHIERRTSVNRAEPAARTAVVAARLDPVFRQPATLGRPPSQHDSIFWRQSWHHQAERSQNRRCARPVRGQSIVLVFLRRRTARAACASRGHRIANATERPPDVTGGLLRPA